MFVFLRVLVYLLTRSLVFTQEQFVKYFRIITSLQSCSSL